VPRCWVSRPALLPARHAILQVTSRFVSHLVQMKNKIGMLLMEAGMSDTKQRLGIPVDQNRKIIPVESLALFCEPPPNCVSR